ncbi:hypothetical protein [Treponema socranskii]|uniref:hypothetical protein n=1 Tax=Treponema socranskii TaxID=53419 RepID=UPI003D6E0B67
MKGRCSGRAAEEKKRKLKNPRRLHYSDVADIADAACSDIVRAGNTAEASASMPAILQTRRYGNQFLPKKT